MENVFNSVNAPIKEEVTLRSIKHEIYTITSNKIALRKFNGKEILDDGRITLIKYTVYKIFDDNIIHEQGLF